MSEEHQPVWNPDDGADPTDDERASAARLARSMERGTAQPIDDPELEALRDVALRVRATAHPDPEAAKVVVDRVLKQVLAQPSVHTGWRRTVRSRWTWAAAAAALVATVGVGVPQRDARAPSTGLSASTDALFTTPVATGSRSAPIARIYDARMRSLRERMLLGGGR